MTSRRQFQRVAITRLRDAEALLERRRYSGAYYLAGYAIECALKAKICKQFKQHTLPLHQRVKEVHTHSLESLLRLAALEQELQTKCSPDLKIQWSTLLQWNEAARYREVKQRDAEDIVKAADRILRWLIRLW